MDCIITFPLMAAIKKRVPKLEALLPWVDCKLKNATPKMGVVFSAAIRRTVGDLKYRRGYSEYEGGSRPDIASYTGFCFSILFTAALVFIINRFDYQSIASILKWLCLVLILYLVIYFMVNVITFSFVIGLGLNFAGVNPMQARFISYPL